MPNVENMRTNNTYQSTVQYSAVYSTVGGVCHCYTEMMMSDLRLNTSVSQVTPVLHHSGESPVSPPLTPPPSSSVCSESYVM